MICKHMNFDAKVGVARIEDVGRFMAEIRIHCLDCGEPFQFLGLQPGMNYDGATVSLDGLEASIGICQQGHQPTPLQGLIGYTINGTN